MPLAVTSTQGTRRWTWSCTSRWNTASFSTTSRYLGREQRQAPTRPHDHSPSHCLPLLLPPPLSRCELALEQNLCARQRSRTRQGPVLNPERGRRPEMPTWRWGVRAGRGRAPPPGPRAPPCPPCLHTHTHGVCVRLASTEAWYRAPTAQCPRRRSRPLVLVPWLPATTAQCRQRDLHTRTAPSRCTGPGGRVRQRPPSVARTWRRAVQPGRGGAVPHVQQASDGALGRARDAQARPRHVQQRHHVLRARRACGAGGATSHSLSLWRAGHCHLQLQGCECLPRARRYHTWTAASTSRGAAKSGGRSRR